MLHFFLQILKEARKKLQKHLLAILHRSDQPTHQAMEEGTRRGQDSQNGLGFTTALKQELSPAARAARAAFLLTPEGKADGRAEAGPQITDVSHLS